MTYHERPFISGKRTWRTLGFNFTRQTSLKDARAEYQRRRLEVAAGRNPYAEKLAATPAVTVGGVIRGYQAAGYPDKLLKVRTGRTAIGEERNCKTLLTHWDGEPWTTLNQVAFDD